MDFHRRLVQDLNSVATNHPTKSTTPTSTIPTLKESLPLEVQLSLTIVFTVLYALLFIFIWIQLILILVYRHKRLSYQSVFLYLCLLWAALRTTLFSFYFNDSCMANKLNIISKWLLYSFPIVLQFLTLSLLELYFSQVVLKSLTTYEPHIRYRKRRYLFVIFFIVNVIFLTLNVTDAVLVKYEPCCVANIVLARVIINESLFVVTSLALCYCIIKLSRASTGNLLLEGQGTTLCQATVICVIIGLIYVSRAVYNIVAVIPKGLPSFGYGWINVSDEGEATHGKDLSIAENRNYGYVSFGVVLFFWEFLPTFFVVVFFRVKRPQQGLGSMLSSNKENKKKFFFDNPNRYNSEDDLPGTSQNLGYDIPAGMRSPHGAGSHTINNSSLHRVHSYGSTGHPGFIRSSSSVPGHIPGTTPTRLFSEGSKNPLLGTNNGSGQ
ncbi:integral membrane protein GPR137B-like [Dendronephthya gigantea]|uniref:integral membrane protein GPR137B-like n=1 Tax=Dendronephthya gigantea TaxID=151771 RepID=UPI001069B331|nr:integral membrane protein GPR137B-like [Dendronephthya gigantea]